MGRQTATINGRVETLPDDAGRLAGRCPARHAEADRHQARLRLRRLRRLHRAARRRPRRELPDAGDARSQANPSPRWRDRRAAAASRAEGVHGARRACNAASARRASSSRPAAFHDSWRQANGRGRAVARGDRAPPCRAISAAAAPMPTSCAPSPRPAPGASMATTSRRRVSRPQAKVTGAAQIHGRHPSRRPARRRRSCARARRPCPDPRARSRAGAAPFPASRRRSRCSPRTGSCASSARRSPRSPRRTGRRRSPRSPPSRSSARRLPRSSASTPRAGPRRRWFSPGARSMPATWRRASAARRLEAERPRPVGGILAAGRNGARAGSRRRAAAADPLLVEGTFRTAAQSHACLEPHAAVARFDGDRLTVHVSTQAVAHADGVIAKRFKLDHGKVRVHRRACRRRLRLQGRPRRARRSRRSSSPARPRRPCASPSTGRRSCRSPAIGPAAELKLSLLPTRDGALKALSLDAYADTGAAVNSTIAGLARLIYPAEAKHLADFDVVSNLPPGSPFRGPGGPPMAFALEQAIDEAALRLALDPIALRKRWDPNPNRQRLYDWAAGLELWRNGRRRRSGTGRYRRGVGVAAGYWLYLWQLGSTVERGDRKPPRRRQRRGAGHRHRQPQRDRQHGGARIRARSRTRSRCASAIRAAGRAGLGRQPDHGLDRAADAGRARAAQGRDRAPAPRRPPAPGSNAPWRELIAAAPDLRITATRAEDDKRAAPGITLAADARRGSWAGCSAGCCGASSNIAVGAGVPSSVQVIEVEVDTWLGHVRVLNVHTGLAVGKIAASRWRAARRPARSSRASATRSTKRARPTRAAAMCSRAGLEDYRIPGIADTPRHRRAFR